MPPVTPNGYPVKITVRTEFSDGTVWEQEVGSTSIATACGFYRTRPVQPPVIPSPPDWPQPGMTVHYVPASDTDPLDSGPCCRLLVLEASRPWQGDVIFVDLLDDRTQRRLVPSDQRWSIRNDQITYNAHTWHPVSRCARDAQARSQATPA